MQMKSVLKQAGVVIAQGQSEIEGAIQDRNEAAREKTDSRGKVTYN